MFYSTLQSNLVGEENQLSSGFADFLRLEILKLSFWVLLSEKSVVLKRHCCSVWVFMHVYINQFVHSLICISVYSFIQQILYARHSTRCFQNKLSKIIIKTLSLLHFVLFLFLLNSSWLLVPYLVRSKIWSIPFSIVQKNNCKILPEYFWMYISNHIESC